MIGNTPEYFQADNLILSINDMINGSSLFDDMKPIRESDIVNLSLDILRILVQIHLEEDREEIENKRKTIQDISESVNSFVKFADISIDCQRSHNKDLNDVLLAIGTAKDIDALITKILVYGSESS